MKKLILFVILIVTTFGFSQPPTNPTVFSNGIKITGGNPTVTSATYLTTTEANGVQSKILPSSLGFVGKTGNEDIDGNKNFKQRINFIRQFDGNPAASVGYEDTGFNFSISAGGGGSYLTFKQQASEVARFGSATGAFLINTTTETAGYKLIANGKGFFNNNLGAPNFTDLSAKRWYIFGDSFSNGLDGSDYVSLVRDNLDLVAVTYAVPGDTSGQQLTVLKNQLAANPTWLTDIDIISLHVGVNDQYSSSVPLGNINSAIGSGSISANIKEFIELALARNPKIRLFIITPPEANGGTSGRTYKSPNALGWNLENLSTTISEICKYYSVQCVDLYSLAQFNLQTIPTMTSDGLHPSNPQGLKQLADIVSRSFTSNNSKGTAIITQNTTAGYMPYKAANNSMSNSKIYYDGTTNTGVNTTSPSTTFDVNGIVNTTSRYTIANGVKANQFFGAGNFFNTSDANNVGIRNDAGKILFSAGSSMEDMTIETNGNVSIAGKITAGAAAIASSDVERKGEHDADLALKANLASPTFTGDPKAPTPAPGDNDASIPTTAFVQAALAAQSGTYTPTITGIANFTSSTFVSASYTVVGGSVTVMIDITVKPTSATTLTEFSISLPVTVSVFGGTQASIGTGTFSNTDYLSVRVSKTNSTTAKASFKTATDTNSGSVSLIFTYQK